MSKRGSAPNEHDECQLPQCFNILPLSAVTNSVSLVFKAPPSSPGDKKFPLPLYSGLLGAPQFAHFNIIPGSSAPVSGMHSFLKASTCPALAHQNKNLQRTRLSKQTVEIRSERALAWGYVPRTAWSVMRLACVGDLGGARRIGHALVLGGVWFGGQGSK